jgi:hypothetical protein
MRDFRPPSISPEITVVPPESFASLTFMGL